MKKFSGVVTVFMSLVLLMVLSLLFTLLESARSEGLKLKALMTANIAIESSFACYDTYLFEKYGLLYFAGRDSEGEELSDITLEYAKKNSGEKVFGKNWLRLNAETAYASSLAKATDNNGEVFITSVCDYMKGAGLVETAKNLAESVINSSAFSGDNIAASNSDEEIDLGKVKESVQKNEDKINSVEINEDDEIAVENKEELEREYKNAKNNLKALINSGFLSLVCDDATEISDATYDMDNAPSALEDAEKSRSCCDIEEISTTDMLLFDEFVFENFNHYKKDEDGKLEIEYVICGKDSNLSNLSSIAKRIALIRFVIDYAKIRSDSAKTAKAYAIGVAVAGFTGVPALVTAVKESVLMIWAVSDAIDDTREIFAGEKDDKGLSYEEYLRAFLLLKNKSDKSYRTMDVIQWTMCEEEEAFRFSNSVYGAKLCVNFSGKKLFPLLPSLIEYSYSMETAYSYGRVTKYG